MDTTSTPVRPTAVSSRWQRAAQTLERFDLFLLLVAALPFAILWFYSAWIYTYPSFLDPWYSIGYFLDLRPTLRFSPTYYVSGRLACWLPGALAYATFSPLMANYVLRLGYYFLAVFGFYDTVCQTLGRKTALLGTFLLGCYWHFLNEIGWNYVDGCGIAYVLMTFAMLARAGKRERRGLWMVLAGFWFCAAMFTNLTLAAVAAPAACFHLWRTWTSGRERLIRLVAWDTLGALLGYALLAGPLAAWYYHETHTFILGGSVDFAGAQMKQICHNPNRSTMQSLGYEVPPFKEWVKFAHWLDLPFVVLASSVCFLLFRAIRRGKGGSRDALILQWCYLLFFALWAGMQALGMNLLLVSWYASYLIPFAFLALAGQLSQSVESLRKTSVALLSLASLWLTADFFRVTNDGQKFICFVLNTSYKMENCLYLEAALVAAIAAVILAGATRWRHVQGTALVVFLALLAFFNYSRALPLIQTAQYRKEAFRGIMEGVATIRNHGFRTANVQFWYKPHDAIETDVYESLNSVFLWGCTTYSLEFPEPAKDPAGRVLPPVRPVLVVLSTQPGAFTQAQEALHRMGRDGQLLEEKNIRCGPVVYTLTLIANHPIPPQMAGR